LSLLGTWSGQPWIAGQSTLLQVFVSIQAMIFCDEPWYNEPGRESQPNDMASKEYNMRIQSLTVPYAINSWLRTKAPIWQDVVDKHFSTHGDQILSVVKTWATKEQEARKSTLPRPHPHYFLHGPGGNSARLSTLAQEYETALKEHRGGGSKRKQPDPPSEEQGGRPLPSFDEW
jgi:hypothetical protein